MSIISKIPDMYTCIFTNTHTAKLKSKTGDHGSLLGLAGVEGFQVVYHPGELQEEGPAYRPGRGHTSETVW